MTLPSILKDPTTVMCLSLLVERQSQTCQVLPWDQWVKVSSSRLTSQRGHIRCIVTWWIWLVRVWNILIFTFNIDWEYFQLTIIFRRGWDHHYPGTIQLCGHQQNSSPESLGHFTFATSSTWRATRRALMRSWSGMHNEALDHHLLSWGISWKWLCPQVCQKSCECHLHAFLHCPLTLQYWMRILFSLAKCSALACIWRATSHGLRCSTGLRCLWRPTRCLRGMSSTGNEGCPAWKRWWKPSSLLRTWPRKDWTFPAAWKTWPSRRKASLEKSWSIWRGLATNLASLVQPK